MGGLCVVLAAGLAGMLAVCAPGRPWRPPLELLDSKSWKRSPCLSGKGPVPYGTAATMSGLCRIGTDGP